MEGIDHVGQNFSSPVMLTKSILNIIWPKPFKMDGLYKMAQHIWEKIKTNKRRKKQKETQENYVPNVENLARPYKSKLWKQNK